MLGTLILFKPAQADSPITSTYFCTEYFDVELVKKASEEKILTAEMTKFLLDDDTDFGVRAALVNALGWDSDGKSNAKTLEQALLKKYKMTSKSVDYNEFSAGDLMTLAYLKAMDNYFEVEDALQLSEMAAKKARQSYTVQLVHSLIKSQHVMSSDFCSVYTECASVQFNSTLNKDLRDDADAKIFEYIDIYQGACTAEQLEEAKYPEVAPEFFVAANDGQLDVLADFLQSGLDIETRNKSGLTALMVAADKGQLPAVKFLVEKGADPKVVDDEGNTALMYVADGVGGDFTFAADPADVEAKLEAFDKQVKQLPATIEFLVAQGVDINAVNNEGGTAFSLAACKGKVKLLQTLHDLGALPSVRDESGRTALMYAAFYNELEAVRFLIDLGMDVEEVENDGYSAFIIAAEAGHEDIVRYFVQNDLVSDIDARLDNGCTAAYRAFINNNDDIGVYLIQQGADPNASNEDGYTPFLVALANNDIQTARFMVQQGAEVNAMVNDDFRITTLASIADEPIALKFLVDHGADINLADKDGNTPLMEASRKGNHDNVKYLLSIGANINALDDEQRSALDYAANEGQTDVCEMLIESGAKVNKRDINQATPLMHAASGGNLETVILLVKSKAKVNVEDSKLCTPLIYASKNGDVDIVEFLLKKRAKLNVADHNGTTPLMFATQHPELIEFLAVQRKLKIDQTNDEQQTALMMAAATEQDFAVEMLLEAGANSSAEDNQGRTVEAYAQTEEMRTYIATFED